MKFALCIPVYGDTKAKFTQSLSNMLVHFLQADFRDPDGNPIDREVEIFMVSCSMLTESRHRLVAEALAWGADYMLWMDADHVFPKDALARLWAHNLPVVGCNYPRRSTPTAPTAAIKGEDGKRVLLYTGKDEAERGLVEPVSHMGFGLCLIDMKVFDVLQAHAEKEGDGNFLPLFKFVETPDKIGMIGEDVFFFGKLTDAGVPLFIDHALSWEVGHLHEGILTNAHAWVQQEQWRASQVAKAEKFAVIEQDSESEWVAGEAELEGADDK